jgi:hypothetical protein
MGAKGPKPGVLLACDKLFEAGNIAKWGKVRHGAVVHREDAERQVTKRGEIAHAGMAKVELNEFESAERSNVGHINVAQPETAQCRAIGQGSDV